MKKIRFLLFLALIGFLSAHTLTAQERPLARQGGLFSPVLSKNSNFSGKKGPDFLRLPSQKKAPVAARSGVQTVEDSIHSFTKINEQWVQDEWTWESNDCATGLPYELRRRTLDQATNLYKTSLETREYYPGTSKLQVTNGYVLEEATQLWHQNSHLKLYEDGGYEDWWRRNFDQATSLFSSGSRARDSVSGCTPSSYQYSWDNALQEWGGTHHDFRIYL